MSPSPPVLHPLSLHDALPICVWRHVGNGDSPADGRDVDDASAAAPAEMRNRFANNVVGRPKVKHDRFFEIGGLHVRERADFNDAGIVDHNIEGAEVTSAPSML